MKTYKSMREFPFFYSLNFGLITIAIASCINIWYGKCVWRSTLDKNAVCVGWVYEEKTKTQLFSMKKKN